LGLLIRSLLHACLIEGDHILLLMVILMSCQRFTLLMFFTVPVKEDALHQPDLTYNSQLIQLLITSTHTFPTPTFHLL
jgi:hypothetical protein